MPRGDKMWQLLLPRWLEISKKRPPKKQELINFDVYSLQQLIFELYNFSALVPESYIAQWVGSMLMFSMSTYINKHVFELWYFSVLLP